MAKFNPMKVLEELTGEIKALIATKPALDGLEEKISQLFRNHGLKPNKKGIKQIVEDYRQKSQG